jgi:putative ABC transport system permease protein
MLRYLPLIIKNCWRNRRRTLLTVASIGISMCLLGVVVAMYDAFYLSKPEDSEAARLVTRNRISLTVSLPKGYLQRIKAVPGVREAMMTNWFGGSYKDARDPKNQFARFIVEPEKLFAVYPEFRIPDDQRRVFERERTACVIGRDLADQFQFKLGDRINITGDIFPGNYELVIRGIFDSPRDSHIMYFNREYAEQALTEYRRGFVGMYYILIDDPQQSAAVSRSIDDMFRNADRQTKTESEQAFVVGFLALLGNVKMFLIAISAAVMFTVLLVSANTMAMSVRERRREVGVLKTLGYSQGIVLGLILAEACAISMAGGLIGYSFSTLLLVAVMKTPFGGFLPGLQLFQPLVALTCILIAGAIGVLSSLVPGLSASRSPIVEALRSTD